jgi:hypothetical protein
VALILAAVILVAVTDEALTAPPENVVAVIVVAVKGSGRVYGAAVNSLADKPSTVFAFVAQVAEAIVLGKLLYVVALTVSAFTSPPENVVADIVVRTKGSGNV